MNINEILTDELIIFDVKSSTKEDVIKELSKVLVNKDLIANENAYIASVLEREYHSTTGVGNGIAIPHGKSSTVKKSSVVFAKANHPIEWESLDGNPVNIIFLMAIREKDKENVHLKMLSKIAAKLMDDQVINGLRQANDADKVKEIFEKGEEEL